MNRIIKFRGKSLGNNQWVCGSLIVPSDPQSNYIIENECAWYVDSNSIGQFTGLYDINGKEIYEGDILEYGDILDGTGVRCKIVWDTDNHPYAAGFITRDADELVGAYPLNLYWIENKTPKVIGNIYDNFELLNAKSNERTTKI